MGKPKSMRFVATKKLRDIRESLMSQEELVDTLKAQHKGHKYERTSIVYIESGKRTVDLQTALTISRILGVDISEIFTAST